MIIRALRLVRDEYCLRRDPIAYARNLGVTVGERCRFLGLRRTTFGSEPYLVSIGDHVTITSGVSFVTHDGGVWVLRERMPDIDVFAPIKVGSNVFIGICSVVLPGVTIGDDCVIGAGSVVSKSIPSGTVAAGVPAREIRKVDEYAQRVQASAVHVRSMSAESKRKFLVERFGR